MQQAFHNHYAAQCGFCTPGMILASTALIERNGGAVERADVLEALGGHYCRCTGYVKIVDAVLAASRGEVGESSRRPAGRKPRMKAVGARLPRYDGIGHVTGRTQYVDDVRVGRHLWAKALRSPHHHAGIVSLDTAKAEAMKGVHAVITHGDVPKNVYGHLEGLGVPADEPLLAEDDVRYKGQPIAVVAAESEEAARAAVAAIEIEFEEREPLFDMRLALDPEAAKIHQWGNVYPHYGPYNHRRVRKGDIDWAFDKADTIVEGVYRPQAIEQMPLETQVAMVVPEPSGRLTIYSCTQAMYFSMGVVAAHLQVPLNKLKFVGGTVGGGFGGKVDTASRDDLRAARDEVAAAREVALDPRGGVPRLVDARPVAHRARRRGDEGRLDPRPAHADAARLGRVRALLAVRPDEARVPPLRRVHDPESALRRVRRVHEPRADDRDARVRRHVGLVRGRDAPEPHRHVLGIDPWELRLKNANRIGDTSGNGVVLKDPSTVPVTLAAAERVGIELGARIPRNDRRAPRRRAAARAPRRPTGAERRGRLMAKHRGRGFATIEYPTG